MPPEDIRNVEVTRRTYPCGAIAVGAGRSPVPEVCPEHGAACAAVVPTAPPAAGHAQETAPLPDWRPIDSAPKDGRQVWLWWSGKRRLAHWHEAVNPPPIGGRFANWLPDDKGSVPALVRPTMWAPTPDDPPAALGHAQETATRLYERIEDDSPTYGRISVAEVEQGLGAKVAQETAPEKKRGKAMP